MFYKALYNFLLTQQEIVNVVSEYNGDPTLPAIPAIFARKAPEDAVRPYITFSISVVKLPDSVIVAGTVDVDYWERSESNVQADIAAQAIEDTLDLINLRSDIITDIRFRMSSDGYVPDEDTRDIHHNTTFDVRGARIRWMKKTQ